MAPLPLNWNSKYVISKFQVILLYGSHSLLRLIKQVHDGKGNQPYYSYQQTFSFGRSSPNQSRFGDEKDKTVTFPAREGVIS